MPQKQTNRQLRSFGLIVATGFAVIALFPLVRGHNLRTWSLVVSVLLAAIGLIMPAALRSFYHVWMIVGEGLGWLNSRIILGAVFFVILLPIAVVRRMLGHDSMQRKFEPDRTTYKIMRTKRPGSHLQQQY
jgi:hypothetical protein